jgi:hypothetical protein
MRTIIPALLLGSAAIPWLAHAKLTDLHARQHPQVIRSSESWHLDPQLPVWLKRVYDGLGGPDSPLGKETPGRPSFQLNLIAYQSVGIIIHRIHREGGNGPACLWVAGTVEGESDSHVQLIFIGDSLVGSIRLESGATYLVDTKSPGRYVVEQIDASRQVSASAAGDGG